MKTRFVRLLSIVLAVLLQTAPLLRSFLPSILGLAPSSWGLILRLGVGAAALL